MTRDPYAWIDPFAFEDAKEMATEPRFYPHGQTAAEVRGYFDTSRLSPSGLDTQWKWDATGRPVPRGPPTRIVEPLTDSERVVK